MGKIRGLALNSAKSDENILSHVSSLLMSEIIKLMAIYLNETC